MILFIFFILFFFFSLPSFAATITYEYDALNRLTTVNYGNGYPEVYGYDNTGNRTSLDIVDAIPPTGTIDSNQITISDGEATITGTASDLGSGVDKVEISLDGGVTWHTATGTTNWSYTWAVAPGSYSISLRITDNKGNISETSYTITIFTQLYGDFGSGGIWMYNGITWTQLTPSDPEAMITAGSLLYGDFGSGGIWMYNGTTWAQLTPSDPETMVVSGSLLYGDFGSSGIWQWDGTTWTQLTPSNPETMIASGSLLYGDFGSGGIWMYNGTTWTQLTPSDPETMVAQAHSYMETSVPLVSGNGMALPGLSLHRVIRKR